MPLGGVVTFGAFVFGGVGRKRPEIHPTHDVHGLVVGDRAAMGRMPALNAWYAGTWLEHWFSAFVTTLVLGVLLLG